LTPNNSVLLKISFFLKNQGIKVGAASGIHFYGGEGERTTVKIGGGE